MITGTLPVDGSGGIGVDFSIARFTAWSKAAIPDDLVILGSPRSPPSGCSSIRNSTDGFPVISFCGRMV